MKKFLFLAILNIGLFNITLFAQQNRTNGELSRNIDSLLILLKTDKADTNKLIHLYQLSDENETIDNYTDGIIYGIQALELSDIIFNNINDERTKKTAQKFKAKTYNNIGIIYREQGNYPEALKNHLASLKIYEAIGYKKGIASSYNSIGIIYNSQGNYPEALKNDFACLKILIELGDKNNIANSYDNIGIVYSNDNYVEALKFFKASLKIREMLGDKRSIANSYFNIGSIYLLHTNCPEALKNIMTSLKLFEEMGDIAGIADSYCNIGNIFTKQKKFRDAEKCLNKAIDLSRKIGDKENLRNTYIILTELDSAKSNFKGAYENHKLYILYRDSIDNEETRKKTIQSQMMYDFEKKEAVAKTEHKKEMENQKALAEEKSRKQKIVIGFVLIGLILVLIFAIFILRSLRITRKQKQMIETQKDEIETQRDMVTEQKEHIEEIHKEVTDSIQYAKRIQNAVLPSFEFIKERIPGDFFILFKPKDIVSGDFYFVEKRKNMFFIAIADCTGHGVPGAFMSMLGISFLNEIIVKEEVKSADHVLNLLREQIIKSLQQKGISGEQKDGMDIAFCAINTETLEMQFAGANNPIYIITKFDNLPAGRQGLEMNQFGYESEDAYQLSKYQNIKFPNLIELKGDKMPIGIHSNMQPFTNQIYQLQKGDSIYLMSDGYEDQFGGTNRKKFLSKNLKKLLIANCQQPMAEQKQILETTLTDWIENSEQIDDITVMGIKI